MINARDVIAYDLPVRPIQKVSIAKWHAVADQAHVVGLPLIITGLFSKQAESWSPGRFSDQWGDSEVAVVVDLPPHGVPYREKSKDYQKKMSMAGFISLLTSGRSCYLNQVPLREFPELQAELDLKDLKLGEIFAVNLWLGSKTHSGLHFDNADNLFGQVYGEKRAFLISPLHSKFLYPFADNPSKSQVDLEAPDLKAYPKCAKAEVWKCDLRPGDGLFIPRGWWHHIAADDVSISINCWHGHSLTDLEYTRLCMAGGGRVLWRTAYDFIWHGIFKRPYQYRLFSPPPPGIKMYNKIKLSR